MDYAVIMAGGTGKRLWPLSRKKHPKQVLKLLDGQTLIKRCFDRLTPLFDFRNIIVLTNAEYVDTVRENLPDLPYDNVIAEPAVRDTSSAIGLAATVLNKFDANATMVIVTADQVIEPEESFTAAIRDALAYINSNPNELITFGIKPTFADTQFGYIKCSNPKKVKGLNHQVYKVEEFKEKPDMNTATQYLESGDYLWNSGMFVWKAKTILDMLSKFLPVSDEPLKKIKMAWGTPDQQFVLKESFVKLPKISIDYAVMERSQNVHAIKLECRWLDLGAFSALADFVTSDENNNLVVATTNMLLDCKNNIIVTEVKDHLIAAIGLENIVVAHTPDATLVCHMDQTSRLKELLELIKEQNGEKYL